MSKEKSFDQAVISGALEVKSIALMGFLVLFKKVQTNSPTKCDASAFDPPFPATNILQFEITHLQNHNYLVLFFNNSVIMHNE